MAITDKDVEKLKNVFATKGDLDRTEQRLSNETVWSLPKGEGLLEKFAVSFNFGEGYF